MDRSNFIDRAIASALVTEVLISPGDVDRRWTANCAKNHIWPAIFSASAGMTMAQVKTDSAAVSQGPRRRGPRATRRQILGFKKPEYILMPNVPVTVGDHTLVIAPIAELGCLTVETDGRSATGRSGRK
jgi:hypothetical protein